MTKYMAPEGRRAGCFIVTSQGNRRWEHPDTGAKLDLSGLVDMLDKESVRLEEQTGGSIRLFAQGLDLSRRLLTEKAKAKAHAADGDDLAEEPHT